MCQFARFQSSLKSLRALVRIFCWMLRPLDGNYCHHYQQQTWYGHAALFVRFLRFELRIVWHSFSVAICAIPPALAGWVAIQAVSPLCHVSSRTHASERRDSLAIRYASRRSADQHIGRRGVFLYALQMASHESCAAAAAADVSTTGAVRLGRIQRPQHCWQLQSVHSWNQPDLNVSKCLNILELQTRGDTNCFFQQISAQNLLAIEHIWWVHADD